jgi:hypothetical protein
MEASNKVTLDDVLKKLAAKKNAGPESEVESLKDLMPGVMEERQLNDDILSSPYIQAAAVLVFYDPGTIQPFSNETISAEKKEEGIKQLIGCSQMAIDTQKEVSRPTASSVANNAGNMSYSDKISYLLRDDLRKAVLERLYRERKIKNAVNANKNQAAIETLQKMFTRCLLGDIPILQKLDLEQLNALSRVVGWLPANAGTGIPSRHEITRRIEMTEMLMPFKHLTGTYSDGVFVEHFKGRVKELAELRKYVGVAPPQGSLETIGRIVSSFVSDEKKPPMLIYGIGGVGKSSLMAKFILEHAEAHTTDRFPFVYLDFDRPYLSAADPNTLLIEAARQLSIQYSEEKSFCKKAREFYQKWLSVYGTMFNPSGSSEHVSIQSDVHSRKLIEDRKNMNAEFIALIEGFSVIEKRPFLMILDTFEEVQYKGVDYVEELYNFMSQLQNKYPLLRPVVAGRAAVTDFETITLELSELDPDAAQGYLLKKGNLTPKEARLIANKVGGNPLSLKLAAELVREMGVQELKNINLFEKQFLFFEKRFSQLEVQGILYKRILGHIHNPDVHKLAYPGLVLRLLTPELILHVLAKPCELKINTIEEARALFEETAKEVALITKEDPETLRHRPDVRKVMFKLITQSDPDKVQHIHKLAIDYYENREGKPARAEEIYHRLCLNESPRQLESRWVDGVQDYLLGSIDELPPKAQAYLSGRTGIENVDLAVWEKADVEDHERRAIRRTADLLNSGMAEKAVDFIIKLGPGLFSSGILSLFLVKAFSQLGKVNEARQSALQALNEKNSDGYSEQVTNELKGYIKRLRQSPEVDSENIPDDLDDENDKNNIPPPDDEMDLPRMTDYNFIIKKFMAFFDQNGLNAIRDAIMDNIGYSPSLRTILLSRISNQFKKFLAVDNIEMVQLDLDLIALNKTERLTDGTIPFESWLDEASRYLKPYPDASRVILEALATIASRTVKSDPVDNPVPPPKKVVDAIVKEKILFKDDMLSFPFLEAGVKAGNSVARIQVKRYDNGVMAKSADGDPAIYLGTGWLLTQQLVITNHHVINARGNNEPDAGKNDFSLQAGDAIAEFDFNTDNINGQLFKAAKLEASDQQLDYAIIRLEQVLDRQPLSLFPQKIEVSEIIPQVVNIIQHPRGYAKKVALRNNHIFDTPYPRVRYFTATDGGSSGSAVFDDKWQVIALHRASSLVKEIEYQNQKTAWVNEGVQIEAIVQHLKTNFPVLAAEIGV